MPVLRINRANQQEAPEPTPEPTPLTLEELKVQLRIDDDDGDSDAIVTEALEAAVSFVKSLGGVTEDEINENPALRHAVIIASREFFNGFRELPPTHAVYAIINGAVC